MCTRLEVVSWHLLCYKDQALGAQLAVAASYSARVFPELYQMEGAAAEAWCSSVTFCILWTADIAELPFLDVGYWGLLIGRVTRLSLPRSSPFFSILSFSQQSELTSHLLLLLHPKYKKFLCLQLLRSLMAVVCTCLPVLPFIFNAVKNCSSILSGILSVQCTEVPWIIIHVGTLRAVISGF